MKSRRLISIQSERGVTLIELMVVVAIISILAALSSVAYGRYIKSGKIQRLRAIANEVHQGEENFRSRNNSYYPSTTGTVTYAADTQAFQNLLDYAGPPPDGVTVTVRSWPGGAACPGGLELIADCTLAGFEVVVEQDLDPSNTTVNTQVVFANSLESPMILNEFE